MEPELAGEGEGAQVVVEELAPPQVQEGLGAPRLDAEEHPEEAHVDEALEELPLHFVGPGLDGEGDPAHPVRP